jgi:Fur family transcriptional regulator, ferric uptake regulator
MPSEDRIMDQFSNMRLTTQRQIILEELAKVTSHPTANEVYDMVRRRLPRIGLGTVYRNLELMAESGLILKLEVGGTQKRFDATVNPHYHIRCIQCNKVDDIEIPVQHHINDIATTACDYQILGHHIEFSGICDNCTQRQKDQMVS